MTRPTEKELHQQGLSATAQTPGIKTLRDLTLWRWWFFLRRYSHDTLEQETQHWKNFSSALDSVVQWRGGWETSVPTHPPSSPPAHQTTLRFASFDWRHVNGSERVVEARSLLDTFYIQTGCAMEGASAPTTFRLLRDMSWSITVKPHAPLGTGICARAELAGDAEELEDSEAATLARAMLEEALGRLVGEMQVVKLSCGFLASAVETDNTAWALIVRGNDDARRQAGHLLHRLVPQLILANLKVNTIMRDFAERLAPTAQDLETKLHDEFKQAAKSRRRLQDVEQVTDAIAQKIGPFIEIVNEHEELLETLKVNLNNVKYVIQDSSLSPHQTTLQECLVSPIQLSIEQIATNLQYLNGTIKWADHQQQSLNTLATLRSNRWQRSTAILLGLFVVFGVVQTFPEIGSWKMRLLGAGILALLMYGLILWSYRRE